MNEQLRHNQKTRRVMVGDVAVGDGAPISVQTMATTPTTDVDATVDAWSRRIAEKPEVAVHMTRTQLRAYAARAALGDVSEGDGDLLRLALRGAAAQERFRVR